MIRLVRSADGRGAFTLVELLVVMSIVLVLAGMLIGAAFAMQAMGRNKSAKVDIESIGVGLAAYRRDFGRFPPDDFCPIQSWTQTTMQDPGEVLGASNECLVYYLGTRLRVGLNTYGPYVEFKRNKLQDKDTDGCLEYPDPFGSLYVYAENASTPASISSNNPRGYDLVSIGPDGKLGGSMDLRMGYQDASEANDKEGESDNITNWSK